MSAALIIVVLVCGYLYINSHIPSKYFFLKSSGWHSYFQVALQGSLFLSQSFFLLLSLWLILLVSMLLLNTPLLFKESYNPFTYAIDILNIKMFGIGIPFILLFVFTAILSLGKAKNAEKAMKIPQQDGIPSDLN